MFYPLKRMKIPTTMNPAPASQVMYFAETTWDIADPAKTAMA